MIRVRSVVAVVGTALAAAQLAGCASGPVPSPPVPAFATLTSTSGVRPSTSAGPRLPGDCGSLINTQEVDLAIGQPMVGRVRSIVGVPEPKIKRQERLTCQYGLPEQPPPPDAPPQPVPLEISVSRYADETSAVTRLAETVESERTRGAAPSTVPVGGVTGTVLISSDRRLLVAVSGPITVAITLAPGVVDDRAANVLSDLGGRVMTALT